MRVRTFNTVEFFTSVIIFFFISHCQRWYGEAMQRYTSCLPFHRFTKTDMQNGVQTLPPMVCFTPGTFISLTLGLKHIHGL